MFNFAQLCSILLNEKFHPSPVLYRGKSNLRLRKYFHRRLYGAGVAHGDLFQLPSILYRQTKIG